VIRVVRRWIAQNAGRALGCALALAVATSAFLGGRAYLWCAPMAEARARCCCPPRSADHDALRIECCDERVAPSLPSGVRAALDTPTIAPAPAVAVAAISEIGGALVRRPACAIGPLARAGPGERVHAILSVYLI
jgi:hypothetical protein